MKLDPYLTTYTRIYSKLIQDLNIKAKTIQLSENIEVNLYDVRFDKELLNRKTKVQQQKIK